jgi:cytochrome P450
VSATAGAIALKETPQVPGLPLLGSAFDMAKGPADFFVHCYRTYGPVCRLSILGERYVLISGVEAANFMGTRAGKDRLRSKEFWEGLKGEFGAKRMLTGEDGDSHKELRDIMRNGYSKESIKGRYNELVATTDGAKQTQKCRELSTLLPFAASRRRPGDEHR